MRKMICLMLAAILLLAMPAGALAAQTDAEHVRSLIAQLPTVEQFQAMNSEEQLEAYNLTQSAYDAYMALSDGEKQKLEGAEEQFEALFTYFNTLIAPAAEAAAPETAPEAEAPQEPATWVMLLCLAFGIAVGMNLSRKRKK